MIASIWQEADSRLETTRIVIPDHIFGNYIYINTNILDEVIGRFLFSKTGSRRWNVLFDGMEDSVIRVISVRRHDKTLMDKGAVVTF